MRKIYFLLCLVFFGLGASAQLYWNTNGAGALLTATNWGTLPAGPFTTAWTNSSNINFTANSAITNVTNTPVGNLTVNNNNTTVTWTPAGTYSTGAGVRTFDIAGASTLIWNGQSVSTAAGTGFIKNGAGIWNIGAQGNAYTGGFTLNNGIVVIGGTNALGTGALIINGGTIAPNSATARTPGVTGTIAVGGDFQLGDLFSVPAGTGNITFTNAVSLGAAATRKIIIGSFATYSFNGVMSGAGTSVIIDNSAGGTISYGAVNTYTGGTTIQGGGILRMGLANALPATGSLTLNGGTFITGATTGFTQSTGALNLALGGSLVLGTGTHSISFLNSSAVSWSAAATLIITGWTGGYNGTSGTAGRIFVGSDATGLTAGQLAQITFRDASNNPFPAVILSTGEVVPGASVTVPDIALSSPNPAVSAGNIAQGSTNNPIYRFDLSVTTANATLSGVTINTSGAYAASDFTTFRCWYSADNVFSSATDVLLSTITPAVAGSQVFTPFTNQTINSGNTGYIFITATATCAAVVGNNISVNAITTADISFLSGNKTGSAFAGGLQTIIAATPNDVTTPAASVANASSSVSWVNPAGCYSEVMIIASQGAANTGGIPTGDGTAYTASLTYGTGTPYGNGFIVYKGATSPQVVSGLINGTIYYYKFYTRLGTIWSTNDIEVSATPQAVTTATDYFRSVASGDWATLATWQSSSDSASWIPATLVPGPTASHVTIQSPDSVWISGARTTINLTVNSGGIFDAGANLLVLTSRLNLIGTASFYQGGSGTIVPGVTRVLATTSNYHFNGTQAGASGAYPEFGNLIWEPIASGNGTFQNTITTTMPFTNGLVIRGYMTINLRNATPIEVRFATGASTLRSHLIAGNLNIISANSTVVIMNGTLAILSSVTVGGNINISAGILKGIASSGNGILNLSGNINNTGGIIQSGVGGGIFSINYLGTGAQSINNTGGTITFAANQADTINKPSGALTLNTPITHAGSVNFSSGILNTSAANLLTMAAGSSVTGTSNASFVNGPVKKIGNTLFTFPVGKTNCGPAANKNGYAALAISNFAGGSLVTDQYTAEYIRGNANAMGAKALGLDHVSACDYWKLDVVGAPTVDLTLSWQDSINNCTTASPYVNNPPSLVVAHYNGATWNTFGAPGTAIGSSASGTVTWPGVSIFSPFAIGSIDFSNPLPITINYFNGTKNNGNHLLNWQVTCVSTPHATIEVERSTDGRNYNSIYSIFATALRCQQPFNYTDNQPAKGVNYYRLKMTDATGKVSYSSIVSLINAVKGIDIMNIAPNPVVNSSFNLQISSADKAPVELVITDMQGRILQKQTVNMIAGFNVIPMYVKNLAAGTYQLFGNTADGRTRVLRFVIQ